MELHTLGMNFSFPPCVLRGSVQQWGAISACTTWSRPLYRCYFTAGGISVKVQLEYWRKVSGYGQLLALVIPCAKLLSAILCPLQKTELGQLYQVLNANICHVSSRQLVAEQEMIMWLGPTNGCAVAERKDFQRSRNLFPQYRKHSWCHSCLTLPFSDITETEQSTVYCFAGNLVQLGWRRHMSCSVKVCFGFFKDCGKI